MYVFVELSESIRESYMPLSRSFSFHLQRGMMASMAGMRPANDIVEVFGIGMVLILQKLMKHLRSWCTAPVCTNLSLEYHPKWFHLAIA